MTLRQWARTQVLFTRLERRCSPKLPSSDAGLFHGAAQIARNFASAALDAIRRGTPHIFSMNDFDYAAPAEVFACRSRGSSPRPVTYRRFDSGAEAIRFAIEELPSDVLFGTVLEVNEKRFDADANPQALRQQSLSAAAARYGSKAVINSHEFADPPAAIMLAYAR